MSRCRVFRDGRVHVRAEKCATCIFRAGNVMQLRPGRVKQMVKSARAAEGTIVCHESENGNDSACRGFFDKFATSPLQIAERLGYITFD